MDITLIHEIAEFRCRTESLRRANDSRNRDQNPSWVWLFLVGF